MDIAIHMAIYIKIITKISIQILKQIINIIQDQIIITIHIIHSNKLSIVNLNIRVYILINRQIQMDIEAKVNMMIEIQLFHITIIVNQTKHIQCHKVTYQRYIQ